MDAARAATTMFQDEVVLSFEVSPDMPGLEDKEFWRLTSEYLQTRCRMTSKLLRTEHSIAMTSLNRSRVRRNAEMFRVSYESMI
jgi:hypothetical protein